MSIVTIQAVFAVAALLPGIAFTQKKRNQPIKPLTVCEVLRDRLKLNGKPVAILGQLDCESSLIDHTCFLAEDRCERPITTDGYVWPNKILIADYWEEGMPKPPSENPQVDEATLVEKLSLLRKTMRLDLHKEPRFKTEGGTITFSHSADVQDEWAVVYGSIVSTPNLRRGDCGDEEGCDGYSGAPAIVIIEPNRLRSFKDEEYPKRTPQ